MNRIAIINPETPDNIIRNLNKMDIKTIKISFTELVEKPLQGHPDLQIFISGNRLFCHRDISTVFLKEIEKYAEIIICSTSLSNLYPEDIPFNIACTGTTAFHLLQKTDNTVREYLSNNGVNLVDVKQGYSKCSTLIVDENSIITSDIALHRAAENSGLTSLNVSHGFINLPGYKYGFIGGSSGKLDRMIFLTGTIHHHPDNKQIIEFINKCGSEIIILTKDKIIDIGSILFTGI